MGMRSCSPVLRCKTCDYSSRDVSSSSGMFHPGLDCTASLDPETKTITFTNTNIVTSVFCVVGRTDV